MFNILLTDTNICFLEAKIQVISSGRVLRYDGQRPCGKYPYYPLGMIIPGTYSTVKSSYNFIFVVSFFT